MTLKTRRWIALLALGYAAVGSLWLAYSLTVTYLY